jgi:ankyrin repeat protein
VIVVEISFKRFRWAFCQLETLRHCLPPTVRRTLGELPESLDETYERVLKEIKKPNRDYAHRLLQCLVVAVRPLKVEELAEVLAVDFDDDEGIPKLNPDWRWEDEEQAVLTSCSSLITIVESDESRVVQFSHFSVKEFLTSTRLAYSTKDVSRYHIDLESAHTVLAQACMGVFLQPEDHVEDKGIRGLCLAGYAAQYWFRHAQFKSVSSSLKAAMEYLFDLDKPHFATWIQVYNLDNNPELSRYSPSLSYLAASSPSNASPLYYAALCGFQDLVEHLAFKHPEHAKTNGGWHGTPLVAALAGRHFQTAKFLYNNGARLDVHYAHEDTRLHSAAYYGDVEMVQVLLGYAADVHARSSSFRTALHDAAMGGSHFHRIHNAVQSSVDVTRILLEHGADVNARDKTSTTSLHLAAENGSAEIVRLLLEHGANVSAEDSIGATPLHEAARNGSVELVRMLLEHGADLNARTNGFSTPLLVAVRHGSIEVVRTLLEHGANLCMKEEEGRTPLHDAAGNGNVELVRMLLERGADINAQTNDRSTPLLMATICGDVEVVRTLLKHGTNVGTEDEEGRTPLHEATRKGSVELVRVLLEHSADINARTKDGSTPLLLAAGTGYVGVVQMLLEHSANVGADINARNSDCLTPLLAAARYGHVSVMRVLLEHGANVEAEDKKGRTSFQIALKGRNDMVELLSSHGAKGVFSVSTSSLCLP